MKSNKYEWSPAFLNKLAELNYASPRKFALAHGIETQTLYASARARVHMPSFQHVIAVARALEITVPAAIVMVWPFLVNPDASTSAE
jgi:hypothetical protein